MKTLVEVIKAMENCYGPDAECCDKCQYTKEINAESICLKCNLEDDALHYLKEYRKLDSLDAVAFPEDADDNAPLTWDELQTMEGKPVWIEGPLITGGPHWIIVGPSHLYDGKIVGYGKTWQAYRKERS